MNKLKKQGSFLGHNSFITLNFIIIQLFYNLMMPPGKEKARHIMAGLYYDG